MSTNLSEKSTAIARIALLNLVASIEVFFDGKPDDIVKNKAEVQVALDELGPMNNRMQVHCDAFRKKWGIF